MDPKWKQNCVTDTSFTLLIIIIIIISLFAHSETMIVSIEHSKTHSMYKYNNYIQQLYITI